MSPEAKAKMQAALEHLEAELRGVRSGRANSSLIENVEVTYYDQQMPIKALAGITTPDAKSITITPWDANAAGPIEKALREAKNLQLNPQGDGKAIHINVPPPTAERRQQLVKQVSELAEEAQISLRNARHEELKDAQEQLKDKAISEDEFDRIKKQLDESVSESAASVDAAAEAKKREILAG